MTPALPLGGWPKGQALPASGPAAEWLYHFSEDGDIAEFVPLPVKNNPESEPLAWAIDSVHAPLYFFPRDCPRIACWPLPTSTAEDVQRYREQTDARMVIAIESDWLARLRTCRLYRYTFAPDGWKSLEDHGCHVTAQTVTPTSIEPVGDLLTALADSGVELRITPSLWPQWDTWLQSSLHYSGIRLRNAAPRN